MNNDRWRERERADARYRDDEDEYQRRREAWRDSQDAPPGPGQTHDRSYGRSYGESSGQHTGQNYGHRYEPRSAGQPYRPDYRHEYTQDSAPEYRERDRGERQRGDRDHERGWWDRTKDEVRSWMGDQDAGYRRQADHRGRGPKGYVRSDERIREDVNDRLMEDWGVDATDIEVTVAGAEVTLSGTVDGRESKRRAEDIAADVLGVKDVQNNLRVRRIDPFASSREVGTGSQTSTLTGTGTTGAGASSTPPAALGSTITPTPKH